jgi:hypothetical protein
VKRLNIISSLFLLFSTAVFALDIQLDIIEKGSELVGTPYRYGGTNPSGFDCSGLVNYLYKPHIPALPRTASELSRYGSLVPLYGLSRGDLVFYATGQNPDEITHVGIYIGQDTLIQAVSRGPERGVILTDLNEEYWKDRYKWIRRVLPYEITDEKASIEIQFNKGTYRGTAINNEPEGEGEMVLENGDTYTGQFHKGVFQGIGQYRYSNGDVYIGEFEKGMESGGEIISPNGDKDLARRDSRGSLIINNRTDTGQGRINYLIAPSTSWDDWLKNEMESFKASLQAEQEAIKSEQERFEEWKKNN